MSWVMVAVGAGVGAGVGQLTGGNTESTLKGAAFGAAGGAGLGALGVGQAGAGAAITTGAQTGSTSLASTAGTIESSMMGAIPLGNASAVGSSAGLGLGSKMAIAGTALQGISAFTGGATSGFSPTENIPLSEPAKKAQAKLQKKAKADLAEAKAGVIDENMARPFIADIVRTAQKSDRAALKLGAEAAGKAGSRDRVISGKDAAAFLTSAGSRFEGRVAPTLFRGNLRRQNFENALGAASNVVNLENQTASLRYGSQLAQQGAQQFSRIAQGKALGDAAQLYGLVRGNQIRGV